MKKGNVSHQHTTTLVGVEKGEINQYWYLENSVAHRFNKLKAKIYNLIEASTVDKKQQDALKGLIKGFANDEYRSCIEDMRYTAIKANYIEDNEVFPISAEPLENRLN